MVAVRGDDSNFIRGFGTQAMNGDRQIEQCNSSHYKEENKRPQFKYFNNSSVQSAT